MDSNSRYQLQQHQQQPQQPNSGLLRFRSVGPGSVLSNLAQGGAGSGSSSAINNKGSIPWEGSSSCPSEHERLVLRFLNSNDSNNDAAASPSLREFEDKPSSSDNKASSSSSSLPSLSLMNSQQGYIPSRFMRHSASSNASSSMDCSFGLVGSVGTDLPRQSSFPAAHFSSNISFHNGYDTMKGVGNYDGVNGSDSELSLSMNRMNNNQISFPSRGPPSSLGMLSHISKMGNEGIGATSHDYGRHGGSNGVPYGSWNIETSHLSEKLSGSKRVPSSNDKLFSDAQNGELGNQVHTLSHHLSFSKDSSEMFAVSRMTQVPSDSVPCKIRAKRGCATHPRSIAERERRTRISERMRKLQELVPNMDKQASTAEMLDLAVVYIKDLQKQFKNLSERRAKCKCISMNKSDSNKTA